MEILKKLEDLLKKMDNLQNELLNNANGIQTNKEYDKLEFYDPINNNSLISLEFIQNYDKEDLKNPISSGSRLSNLMQAFPITQVIKQNKVLDEAYKIIIPERAAGKLMQYKNGLLGTPLIGANGKTISHAGLEKIHGISMNPVLIFTAMSLLTGQYFMAEIKKSLKCISENLEDIKRMILDDKISRNFAIYEFYQDISSNMEIVLEHDDLRVSYLSNVQSTFLDLKQNITSFEKRINQDIDDLKNNFKGGNTTKERIKSLEEEVEKIQEFIEQRFMCSFLYMQGKVLEIQLSKIYDIEYIQKTIFDLKKFEKSMNNHMIREKLSNLFNEKISDRNKIWSYKDLIYHKKQMLEQIDVLNKKFYGNYKGILYSMNKFLEFNKKRNEFIIYGDNLYFIN